MNPPPLPDDEAEDVAGELEMIADAAEDFRLSGPGLTAWLDAFQQRIAYRMPASVLQAVAEVAAGPIDPNKAAADLRRRALAVWPLDRREEE